MTDQTIPVDKLRALIEGEGSAEDKIQAIYEDLLPPVLPDPLFGARATHPEHGEGIVISHCPDKDGEVRFAFRSDETYDGTWSRWLNPRTLTFHTPDHPESLETEEDYDNAPEGTIVAQDECGAFVLLDELWRNTARGRNDHGDMAGIRRRVLRWGWEA